MPNAHRIDPDKLLELCRKRQHDSGVTLSWPMMLQIINQLRATAVARANEAAAIYDDLSHLREMISTADTGADVIGLIDRRLHTLEMRIGEEVA